MSKRYLLFAGDNYYPAGGWDDLVDAFISLEEARAASLNLHPRQWWQIVDLETMEEVPNAT